ncbi:hypothetical protein VP01_1725g1 [Puccinia sorghi]|uniref:Uncharacterized protein n=1 Tax=Puccinia sorghi TaxID=27349 RepID=A0A0L6VFG0_9BASI|nr:hypothetical protein VP01_1725g1 [Puccinia sorghi]
MIWLGSYIKNKVVVTESNLVFPSHHLTFFELKFGMVIPQNLKGRRIHSFKVKTTYIPLNASRPFQPFILSPWSFCARITLAGIMKHHNYCLPLSFLFPWHLKIFTFSLLNSITSFSNKSHLCGFLPSFLLYFIQILLDLTNLYSANTTMTNHHQVQNVAALMSMVSVLDGKASVSLPLPKEETNFNPKNLHVANYTKYYHPKDSIADWDYLSILSLSTKYSPLCPPGQQCNFIFQLISSVGEVLNHAVGSPPVTAKMATCIQILVCCSLECVVFIPGVTPPIHTAIKGLPRSRALARHGEAGPPALPMNIQWVFWNAHNPLDIQLYPLLLIYTFMGSSRRCSTTKNHQQRTDLMGCTLGLAQLELSESFLGSSFTKLQKITRPYHKKSTCKVDWVNAPSHRLETERLFSLSKVSSTSSYNHHSAFFSSSHPVSLIFQVLETLTPSGSNPSLHFKETLLNCLQMTCRKVIQPNFDSQSLFILHSHCSFCTVTVHSAQSLFILHSHC